jgi:PAS domain-containing protein
MLHFMILLSYLVVGLTPFEFADLSNPVVLVCALCGGFILIASLATIVPRVTRILQQARGAIASEKRFRAASESSPDAFSILESVRNAAGDITDFRFSFLNDNAAKLCSSTPEALMGEPLRSVSGQPN